jgi:hypothetical protein
MRWEMDFENRLTPDPTTHMMVFEGTPSDALFFVMGYISAGYALLCLRRMD